MKTAHRSFRRAAAMLLSVLLLLTASACGAAKGRTERYDGFVVRTEKAGTETLAAPERAMPETRGEPDEAQEDYVLNKSSGKFHYPWCSAVKEIAEKNRWEYHGTRQSVLEMGYQPCKNCSP